MAETCGLDWKRGEEGVRVDWQLIVLSAMFVLNAMIFKITNVDRCKIQYKTFIRPVRGIIHPHRHQSRALIVDEKVEY